MSDPKFPPPDDFSRTTPNISLPDSISGSGDEQSDWDKTNYNMPKQPASDDWGKTVTNIKPIDTERQDFGKTMYPGAQNSPTADWAATQANVRRDDFGSNDFGRGGPDKTTPYFTLPEAERAKYQNLPPTPTEQAAQELKEKKDSGGIPGWAWVAAGLMTMFFFAIAVLLGVYFVLFQNPSFEVTVKGAPPGSDILVDKQRWGVTAEDGSYRAQNLRAGEREIAISHPNFTCESRRVTGRGGVNPEPIFARCQPIAVKPEENCGDIKLGEEDKAERCYNAALDALPDQFTPEALVRALNILIINFDSNKFEVPSKRLAALQKGAGFIKRLSPDTTLEVGGHTDSVGNAASNLTLSQNRANSVKDALVKFGVNQNMLQTRGYGPDRPKSDNSTDLGKFYNRRIEYSIVKK